MLDFNKRFLKLTFLTISLFVCLYSKGQSDIEIMNAFKQGTVKGGGNCVSVALIKAGFSKYGFDDLFREIDTTSIGYKVTMRDDSVVTFTFEELKSTSEQGGFRFPQKKDTSEFDHRFKSFAEFCFTAMVKKLALVENYPDLQTAIDDLNDGYDTSKSYELLGVKFKKINCTGAKSLLDLEHLVVNNYYHAVYASRGLYDESSSSFPMKVEKLKWKRFGWKCAYRLCSISGAYQIID